MRTKPSEIMKGLIALVLTAAATGSSSAFCTTKESCCRRRLHVEMGPRSREHGSDELSVSRAEVLDKVKAGAAVGLGLLGSPGSAFARGRATLEASYDRYVGRIVDGGKFYSNDLKKMIERGDWAGIKAATSDPPKKTKADRAKADGGVAERAALAGGFSDARVLVAADLFASCFSDNSISAKTKAMHEQVENMRTVVSEMNKLALLGTGEAKPEGGLFGIGAKKLSNAELNANIRKLYVDGGNYYNQYIYAANDALPITLEKMPYI